jgi:hypothetical protein
MEKRCKPYALLLAIKTLAKTLRMIFGTAGRRRDPWPIYGGGGLRPGVDLRDNASLLGHMTAE